MRVINADEMRLINAHELVKNLCHGCELRREGMCNSFGEIIGCIADEVNNAPTVEAEPIRHGHWIDRGILSCRCSECGCKSIIESPWCPNCGSKMDEVK